MNRNLSKMLNEFKEGREHYDSILDQIYLSDWFDPIYRLIRYIPNLVYKIKKYHYYGKVGLGVHDFAYDPYTLQAAHISRVKDFMISDSTHLMWNDDPRNNRMRKLMEAVGLYESLRDIELVETDHTGKFFSKYKKAGRSEQMDRLFNRGEDLKEIPEKLYTFMFNRACERDTAELKSKKDRLYYLVEKYGDHWWD